MEGEGSRDHSYVLQRGTSVQHVFATSCDAACAANQHSKTTHSKSYKGALETSLRRHSCLGPSGRARQEPAGGHSSRRRSMRCHCRRRRAWHLPPPTRTLWHEPSQHVSVGVRSPRRSTRYVSCDWNGRSLQRRLERWLVGRAWASAYERQRVGKHDPLPPTVSREPRSRTPVLVQRVRRLKSPHVGGRCASACAPLARAIEGSALQAEDDRAGDEPRERIDTTVNGRPARAGSAPRQPACARRHVRCNAPHGQRTRAAGQLAGEGQAWRERRQHAALPWWRRERVPPARGRAQGKARRAEHEGHGLLDHRARVLLADVRTLRKRLGAT